MEVAGTSEGQLYLLVVHDSRSDLRGLVTRCAFHTQHPLMERLTRDPVVRQFDVDRIPLLEEKENRSDGCSLNK